MKPYFPFVLASLAVGLLLVALTHQTVNRDLSGNLAFSEAEGLRLNDQLASVSGELARVQSDFDALLNEDQIKRNRDLTEEVRNIQSTFRQSVNQYEDLIKLREQTTKTQALDALFTQALGSVVPARIRPGQRNPAEIGRRNRQTATTVDRRSDYSSQCARKILPPDSGYSRQKVVVDGIGEYLVDIVTADLNSTRVIVDTASDGDCR